MNKISQLKTAPEGYSVTGLEGVIKKLYPRNAFGASKSVQNILLEREGQIIKCAFWEREEIPFAEGAKIQIMPNSSGKGMVVKDDNYQGKQNKVVSCSKDATIVGIDDWSDSHQTEEVLGAIVTSAENQQTSQASSLPVPLVQNINLMDLCIQSAEILKQKYPNMTNEQFQAITSSFYIECNKQNVGRTMPAELL